MLLVLLAVLGCQLVAWVGPFWVVVVSSLVILHVVARGSRAVRCSAVWSGELAVFRFLQCRCLGWLVRVLFQGRVVRWRRILGRCRTVPH